MRLYEVQSVDEAFVWATEVNLATLEDLALLKKQSKSRIRRQQSICLEMLKLCASSLLNGHAVRWVQGPCKNFGRVSRLLVDSDPKAIEAALDRFTEQVLDSGSGHPERPYTA